MDITDRLSRLTTDHPATVSDEIVAQDLARGRRSLAQRRMRRGAGAGSAILAVAGATVLAVHPSDHGRPARQANPPVTRPRTAVFTTGTSTGPAASALAVKLVDYHGPQKNGFVVSRIPAGWTLADSEPGFLTISPPGVTGNEAEFVNKLTVMLRSADDTGPLQGVPVTVGGRQGSVVSDPTGFKLLTWNDGKHWVQIQAWSNLHWNDQQLIDFARYVTVTANVIVPNG